MPCNLKEKKSLIDSAPVLLLSLLCLFKVDARDGGTYLSRNMRPFCIYRPRLAYVLCIT